MQNALIKDDKIEKYPYSSDNLISDNPSTSFPYDPLNNADVRESFSVVQVFPTKQTSFNERTQFCKRGNPAFKMGNGNRHGMCLENPPKKSPQTKGSNGWKSETNGTRNSRKQTGR